MLNYRQRVYLALSIQQQYIPIQATNQKHIELKMLKFSLAFY